MLFGRGTGLVPSDFADTGCERLRVRSLRPGDCRMRIFYDGRRPNCRLARAPGDPYRIGGHCPERGGYCTGPDGPLLEDEVDDGRP